MQIDQGNSRRMTRLTRISSDFYAWKQLLLSARLSHRNSVCLSACLSVCPSVTRLDQSKRCKL